MNADEFRKAAHAAIEEIIAYNDGLASYPVLPKVKPGFMAPTLPTSAPEDPESWDQIQPDISSKVMPGLTHWQSPKFMAFFPCPVTYPCILGEMYSAAFTAPAFNWLCSPACTEMETVVMDWLAQAFSLPEAFLSKSSSGGGGVIQGSASEAVVTCMVAARERYLHAKCDKEGLAPDSSAREDRMASLRGKMVALATDQTHSSTQKGATIVGTRYRSITTKAENNFSLTGEDLQKALSDCEAQGLEPYYITLTMGTTSTCSVDDFASLKPVLESHPLLWAHVDAAYAGASLVCPEYSDKYSPFMSMVDSFDMNMHKWLLVNFDASCLFVQNRNHLTRALSISAAYYTNKHSDSGLVTDYRDWQIPLGRRFRALRIWFTLRSYGLEGLRKHIRNSVRIGEIFADLVRGRSDLFEIFSTPAFGLTCFRVSHALLSESDAEIKSEVERGMDADFMPRSSMDQQLQQKVNIATQRVTDAVNDSGDLFITASTVAGKTFMRVVSGGPYSEEKYVREAFDIITKATEKVVAEKGWRRQVNGHA